MSIKNKKYDSSKEMIDDLWRVATDEKHPECKEARDVLVKIYETLSKKFGLPISPPKAFTKEEEEKFKVIFT